MIARTLTDAEIALARKIFGSSIDYSKVRVHDGPAHPFQPSDVAMTLEGHLFMHSTYRDDYAAAGASARGLFIHELTHVWQSQNNVLHQAAHFIGLQLKHKFNYARAYAFTLEDGRDLRDFGLEQQAAIVQEYYLTRFEGMPHRNRHCRNTEDAATLNTLYEKTLKNFPGA